MTTFPLALDGILSEIDRVVREREHIRRLRSLMIPPAPWRWPTGAMKAHGSSRRSRSMRSGWQGAGSLFETDETSFVIEALDLTPQ